MISCRAENTVQHAQGGSMNTPSASEITQLLLAWSAGDHTALEKLTPLVYQELHRIARRHMKSERPGHTLQTTALVNEAYMRLVDVKIVDWKDRAHFFAVSAKLMREILVDYARVRRSAKRGGGAHVISLDEAMVVSQERSRDLVELNDALHALAALDPGQSQIVELRFFGGLTVKETSAVLKIPLRKVEREWESARAWLYHELSGGAEG